MPALLIPFLITAVTGKHLILQYEKGKYFSYVNVVLFPQFSNTGAMLYVYENRTANGRETCSGIELGYPVPDVCAAYDHWLCGVQVVEKQQGF